MNDQEMAAFADGGHWPNYGLEKIQERSLREDRRVEELAYHVPDALSLINSI